MIPEERLKEIEEHNRRWGHVDKEDAGELIAEIKRMQKLYESSKLVPINIHPPGVALTTHAFCCSKCKSEMTVLYNGMCQTCYHQQRIHEGRTF